MTLGKLRGPLGQFGKSLFVEGAGLVSEVALKGAKASLELGNRCSKAALKGIENGAVPLKDSSKKLGETFEEIGSEIAAQIRNSKLKKVAVTTVESGKDFAKTAVRVGKEVKTELKEACQVFAQRMKTSGEEIKKEVGEVLAQKAKVLGSEIRESVVSGKNMLCTPDNFEKAKKGAGGIAALLMVGGLAAFSAKTTEDISDIFESSREKLEYVQEDLGKMPRLKSEVEAEKAKVKAEKAKEDAFVVDRAKASAAEYETVKAQSNIVTDRYEEWKKGHEAHLAEAATAKIQEESTSRMIEGAAKVAFGAAMISLGILLLRK